MSRKWRFASSHYPIFTTFTLVGWLDLFTREAYCHILLNALRFCQRQRGFEVYAWVIMPSHAHFIFGTHGTALGKLTGEIKSFTSRQIRKEIGSLVKESRRAWM